MDLQSSARVLALTYPDSVGSADGYPLDPRIARMLWEFEEDDFRGLDELLWKQVSVERVRDQWMHRWRHYNGLYGALQDVRAVSRVATQFNGTPEIQSHLLLRFESGTRIIRALQNADDRYLLEPVNLPRETRIHLVPVSETTVAGWNRPLQTGPRLTLESSDETTLTVLGKKGRQTARKQSNE